MDYTYHDQDDDDDDRSLGKPRPWRLEDGFFIPPPYGWLTVVSLPDRVFDVREIGCWLHALGSVSHAARTVAPQRPKRYYRVHRTRSLKRTLVVHPDLDSYVDELIDDMNTALDHCNCGGTDCLYGPEQEKALRVLVTRKWDSLPLKRRLQLVGGFDLRDLARGQAADTPKLTKASLARGPASAILDLDDSCVVREILEF